MTKEQAAEMLRQMQDIAAGEGPAAELMCAAMVPLPDPPETFGQALALLEAQIKPTEEQRERYAAMIRQGIG